MNCWEFKKCGMDNINSCPAYPNGGTICYLIPNTICNGSFQGSYIFKIDKCRKCLFHHGLIHLSSAYTFSESGFINKRKESREKTMAKITLSPGNPESGYCLDALAIDISKSGIGIFTQNKLSYGEVVNLHNKSIWEDIKGAVVKWSKVIYPDVYRAGLFFLI